MLIANLNNHTPFSDGAFSIDELCQAHLELSDVAVGAVGISDNLFRMPASRECRGDADFLRVFSDETRRYVEETHAARRRWDGKLRILCGCKVYWPLNWRHLDAIRRLLTGIDYVLFENLDWAGLTVLANQARRFPCPVGLANTAVARQMPNTPFDQVVRTLANARIFYELNANFLPLSERDPWFATLAKHRVAVSLGSDTHDDLGMIGELPKLAAYAQRRELEARLLYPDILETAGVLASAG